MPIPGGMRGNLYVKIVIIIPQLSQKDLNKIKCKWGKSKGKSGWVKAISTPEIPQKKEILKKNLILKIKKIAMNIEARLHKCNGRVEIKVNLSG